LRRMKLLLGVLLALGLVAGLYFLNRYWITPATKGPGQSPMDRPPAPAFSLPDLNGRTLNLADYKGKVILLDFWATWCGPCRIEIPGFIELQNRYRDQGLLIIGISMDKGPEPVREFYEEFKMNYPVVMADDKVSELYGGVWGLPTAFLIGRDGRIYAKHLGAMNISVLEEEVRELLAVQGASEVVGFKRVGGTRPEEKIELGDPQEINSEVPGVNLSSLTPAQVAQFKKELEAIPCDCGCKLNLLKCRYDDRSCTVSRRLAREHLKKFLGAPV